MRRSASVLIPAVVVGLLLVTSCSQLAVAAATVNGEKITEAQVESEVDVLRDDPIFGEALRRDPDTRGERRRQILSELIYQAIAEQEAVRLRIKVTDAQAQSLITRTARASGLTEEEFLEQENLSKAEARRLAERGVRRFELMDRVAKDVDVDTDAVREVYEGQEDRFVEVHLERITVRTAEEAREILEEIDDGSSFADIAEERSTDAAKSDGGDLGFVDLASLDVQVQAAISQAVEGGLTDPVEGEDGIQVFRLVERRTKPLKDVEDEIRRSLTQSERDRLFNEWLINRVRESRIVVNPKYGRFDRLAQRPSVVPSSSELRP